MPIVRLVAEGVGPFERLDLDLSDGHGNPHAGPHILAGVNGAGKSTALRTIAWALDHAANGFPHEHWRHALAGHSNSRAYVLLRPPGFRPSFFACTTVPERSSLIDWIKTAMPPDIENLDKMLRKLSGRSAATTGTPPLTTWTFADLESIEPQFFSERIRYNFAAYAPARSLRYLETPDLTKIPSNPFEGSLAFESTVQNEAIQAWLLTLYSKRAIARERSQSTEPYTRSLRQFQRALDVIYGQVVHFEVEIEPRLQPRLRMSGQSLNFSQLPDGVLNTVGWLADFMMRQDSAKWDAGLRGRRPGVLMIDEIDAHLHPRWQRQILPALREALPDVQIIVTSHSPFVISSCPGSRVHVLEVDEHGRSHAHSPRDAPFGQSVTATLKDIFDVDSRFDIQTERELREWNDLKRQEAVARLSHTGKKRLRELTDTLSERSEELRLIVGVPPKLSSSLLSVLEGGKARKPERKGSRRSAH